MKHECNKESDWQGVKQDHDHIIEVKAMLKTLRWMLPILCLSGAFIGGLIGKVTPVSTIDLIKSAFAEVKHDVKSKM
jgi:hypothetical protein